MWTRRIVRRPFEIRRRDLPDTHPQNQNLRETEEIAPGETAGLVLRVEIGYVVPVMRQPAGKQKKLDYPEATNGTRWAAEARRLASKLTPEQEAEHFRRAMAKVYGGKHKEVAGA